MKAKLSKPLELGYIKISEGTEVEITEDRGYTLVVLYKGQQLFASREHFKPL